MATEFTFELAVDREHLHDAVKGLLCTIFFYRTFGLIVPKSYEFLDISYPFGEIPELEEVIESKINLMMTTIDQETPNLSATSSTTTPLGSPPSLQYTTPNPYSNIRFNEPIEEEPEDLNSVNMDSSVHSSIRSHTKTTPQNNVKFMSVVVNFYDIKKLKKPSWFGKIEEEVNFEKWVLNLRVLTMSPYGSHDKFIRILQSNFERLIWEISELANENKQHIPIITSVSLLPFNYSITIKKQQNNETWKEFISKLLREPPN